jgi:hypothetical protein
MMAIKVNLYKNNEKIGYFSTVKNAFKAYANDISIANPSLQQYTLEEKKAKMAYHEKYNTESFFAPLENGCFLIVNYTFEQLQNYLLTIGIESFKADDEGNDIIPNDIDDIDEDDDNNNDVKCQLHHILPKAAFDKFKDLNKYPWNGIKLPAKIHSMFHIYMGGFPKSSDESIDWKNELFNFLIDHNFINELHNVDLNQKNIEFIDGLNDYMNKKINDTNNEIDLLKSKL